MGSGKEIIPRNGRWKSLNEAANEVAGGKSGDGIRPGNRPAKSPGEAGPKNFFGGGKIFFA
jgi:hypothetical protein